MFPKKKKGPIKLLARKYDSYEFYQEGQTIFTVGQRGEVMYVVAGGEVDIVVNGRVVETVGAGGLVGELGIIDDAPRSATAIARSECKLIPVDKKRFAFLVRETPNFANQVMSVMARRLSNRLIQA